MAVSWPATSGATRVSVMRTTPPKGGAASERHSTSRQKPAATSTTRSGAIAGPLAMRLPPLDENRGHPRERKKNRRQTPQPPPVARHLPQTGAQLVDAHEAVD